MWDVEPGDLILGPLNGHEKCITSIAVSWDDRHVISGSEDKTIRMWDAESGDFIWQPKVTSSDLSCSRGMTSMSSGLPWTTQFGCGIPARACHFKVMQAGSSLSHSRRTTNVSSLIQAMMVPFAYWIQRRQKSLHPYATLHLGQLLRSRTMLSALHLCFGMAQSNYGMQNRLGQLFEGHNEDVTAMHFPRIINASAAGQMTAQSWCGIWSWKVSS